MLTNPNTLGPFDRNIEEIAAIVHGVGAILYNLHKTFTQPHGGGGPGPGRSRSRSGSSPS